MIIVRNLHKKYGSIEVLKGLNLDVFDGETLVILGRSGAGKSVLLRQIIGIEKPDAGYIEVDGQRLNSISGRRQRTLLQQMGMLFQSGALFDSLTVGENVAFYLKQHMPEISAAERTGRMKHALEMVGLEGSENKMPSDLSGGMRKRAALARVIIYEPKVILYDEPTTGLDPITAMHINELINKAKAQLKATSIVVTHDIRSAIEIGDRLAFHHEGQIYIVDTKEKILNSQDPLLRNFFSNAIVTT
jgi:phospholipid/cholesterol/gamma-HCH transport system ATP-binding protein